MAELITSEMRGSDNEDDISSSTRPKKQCTKSKTQTQSSAVSTGNPFDPLTVEKPSDADDGDYKETVSFSSTATTDNDIEITNKEVQQF
jgi:hypothetical protein